MFMFPYFSLTTIYIGPIPIHVWGFFVAMGLFVGVFLADRAGVRHGIKKGVIADLATQLALCSFFFARMLHFVFYDPSIIVHDPLEILRVWDGGFSSLGGFIGAAIFLAWKIKYRHPLEGGDPVRGLSAHILCDSLAEGFPLAWAIGRIGCFLIHDHPGTLSHSLLAVQYPNGSRFDLGLIESLTAFFVEGILLFVLWKYPKKNWWATRAVLWSYLPIRFFTDFLRSTDFGADVLWWGIVTPAQVGVMVIFIGTIFFFQSRRLVQD